MVLFVTNYFPPEKGGMQYTYGKLAEKLNTDKFLFLVPENKSSDLVFVSKPNIIRMAMGTEPKPDLDLMEKAIRKLLGEHEINHIVAGEIMLGGQLGLKLHNEKLATKNGQLEYSSFIHGMDLSLPQPGIRKFIPFLRARQMKKLREILKNAKYLIANSNATAQLAVARGANQKSIRIVHPSIDIQEATRKVPEKTQKEVVEKFKLKNKRIILTIGRLVSRKGHDLVIKSLSQIREKFPEINYVIASDGPDRARLEDLAKKEGVDEIVTFVGRVSDDEKLALLDECEVFAMPSRNEAGDIEGFGIVFIEAGLRSKPVIAGRSGGVTDAVKNDITGFLVDPQSVKDFIDKTEKIFGNPETAKRLGQGGFKFAQQFSVDEHTKKIEQIFNS